MPPTQQKVLTALICHSLSHVSGTALAAGECCDELTEG